jgi:hypothetical protein
LRRLFLSLSLIPTPHNPRNPNFFLDSPIYSGIK